ncbi:succinate dehydrogenase / fumarate reductase, flavoprotein subunit [Spirochaetota bacterium]|nr:succinate dehydrogenase / fumarate reductase, flavoprotein subunit [Spirochaetota bacterium]
MELKSKAPGGVLADKWNNHKFAMKLVNPSNRRKFTVLVVGTGLAGASAAATLAEMGYHVKSFCIHDTPRRAHSIAAQGGINAAKNYQNDGDSIYRLFYDTIKGGDYRSREANVYRLAELSVNIIDHCVAQGVPFAREYGGLLANRSFGGAQVSRTFYARGQTGQQLLLGAYAAMNKEIAQGNIEMYTSHEMLDLIVKNDVAQGIITRNLRTGAIKSYIGHAVLLCTGGYGNVYYLSTNAKASNVTATFRAYKRGALFANPCFTQIHPTCIPVSGDMQSKLTLMSESLRNDGRVWVPIQKDDTRKPSAIPEAERDYYLERMYPSFGNLVPRDVASRRAKEVCDKGLGVGGTKLAVYLDFSNAIERMGAATIRGKYGNLFEMYERITGDNPYQTPMRIYPAVHYTMGGLWVDYNLMSTIKGLFVLGEANFSDHGANRLGASALMQGLADGYFVIPYTLSHYLATERPELIAETDPSVSEAETKAQADIAQLLAIKGSKPVDYFHRKLGRIIWDYCGMARNEAGLKKAFSLTKDLKEEFFSDVAVSGTATDLNASLEKAGRMVDYLEFSDVMLIDALERRESCGAHFREEYQSPENEARRNDDDFSHVAAWQYMGAGQTPKLHQEQLVFENVELTQRSYK